ncbi:unnamed protein product [Ectocarpus sp. 12 AP-2014]
MVSSFIDLGLERATAATTTRHRRSHSNTSSSTGSVGSATTLQERGEGTGKGRDDEPRRQGRRRSRDGVQDSPGGVVILEGGDETAVDGGCGDDDDGEDDDAHGVMEDSWEALPSHAWWRDFVSGGEEHVLVWERGPLTELHAAMRDLAWKKASRSAVNEALKRSALAPVVAAAALPLALLEAASGLDDPWGVVRTRALEAGRLLAAVLLSRPVGSRPVTLLGYSMGAKLVFNCLEALAAAPNGRGLGIVENAVMLGTPIGTKRGRWKRVRSAVAGRLINGYSSRDWLLALVYRSKSWSLGVAGTSRVEGCGVENVDLSGLVTWHLSYSRILPTVMAMLRLEE